MTNIMRNDRPYLSPLEHPDDCKFMDIIHTAIASGRYKQLDADSVKEILYRAQTQRIVSTEKDQLKQVENVLLQLKQKLEASAPLDYIDMSIICAILMGKTKTIKDTQAPSVALTAAAGPLELRQAANDLVYGIKNVKYDILGKARHLLNILDQILPLRGLKKNLRIELKTQREALKVSIVNPDRRTLNLAKIERIGKSIYAAIAQTPHLQPGSRLP